jgi:hypothetical protein
MHSWKIADAGQNVSWKMDGEGLPRDGCGTRSGCSGIMLGSAVQCSCRFRPHFANLKCFVFEGSLARKLHFHICQFHFFEGNLARKLHFYIFNFHFLREVSHETLVFTSSTFTFWGKSRTKASFSHLQLQIWRDVSRKLRFHVYLSVYLIICLSMRPSKYLLIFPSAYLPICPSIHLPTHLSL